MLILRFLTAQQPRGLEVGSKELLLDFNFNCLASAQEAFPHLLLGAESEVSARNARACIAILPPTTLIANHPPQVQPLQSTTRARRPLIGRSR